MGGFFSLRGNSPDSSPSGAPSENSQSGAGTPADHIRAEAAQAVQRDVSIATAKRGRPRKDAGTSADDSAVLQAKINAAVTAQLDALHDPKAWEALLCIPADAALTLTGAERWKLNPRERETLGVTGSAAARTMMITNPRALAFFMLGSAMFSIYAPRAIAQLKEMREKNSSEKKNDQPKS